MAKGLNYLHLRAWCAMMGSFDYYLRGELALARADKAPQDVIYRTQENHIRQHGGDPGDPAHYFQGAEGRYWARYGDPHPDMPTGTVDQMERYLTTLRATGRVRG